MFKGRKRTRRQRSVKEKDINYEQMDKQKGQHKEKKSNIQHDCSVRIVLIKT